MVNTRASEARASQLAGSSPALGTTTDNEHCKSGGFTQNNEWVMRDLKGVPRRHSPGFSIRKSSPALGTTKEGKLKNRLRQNPL